MKLSMESKFEFSGTWNSNVNKIPEEFNIKDRSSAAAKGSKLMVSLALEITITPFVKNILLI